MKLLAFLILLGFATRLFSGKEDKNDNNVAKHIFFAFMANQNHSRKK